MSSAPKRASPASQGSATAATSRRRESVSSSQSADPYQRTSLACLSCRKRKTKCSGGRPICRTCLELGHECVYAEAEAKVHVSKSYVRGLEASKRELEERLRAYESAATTQPVAIPAQAGPSRHHQRDDSDSHDIVVNPLTDDLAQLVISPSGQKHFLGNSSSTSLGLRLRNVVDNLRGPMSCGLDISVQYPTYNPAAWKTRRTSVVGGMPKLPPYDFAKRLYAAQYLYIGTIFNFVSPEVFERRLQEAYANPMPDLSDRETCLSYCEVLMIFAYGQLYSVNQWDGHDGPPGFDYFMQALQLLPDLHEEGSPLFVEVLSLIGYFMQNLNRRDAAFLYIGLALRMAISLGLHQEISDPDLDDVAREYRRRLWWSVYSMDRILCAKSGNPITIMDEDIGVFRPSPIPGLETETSSAITLRHYTELSRILGKIMNTIYRKNRKSGSTLVASVQKIMRDLSDWHRDVPAFLRFDFAHPERNTRESVSTFLHYYQCVNMTARPLLFHVVQRRLVSGWKEKEADWRSGWSPTTIATIEACIAAARDSTTMLYAAAKHNLVATYGYMDGEHAFSAAIVLVMATIAFPPSHNHGNNIGNGNGNSNEAPGSATAAAMDMALEVLRGMAEKGNTHIRAQHQLLCNLRGLIVPAPAPAGAAQGLFASRGAAAGADAMATVPPMSAVGRDLLNPLPGPSQHPSPSSPMMYQQQYSPRQFQQQQQQPVFDPSAVTAFMHDAAGMETDVDVDVVGGGGMGDGGGGAAAEAAAVAAAMGDASNWEQAYETFDASMDFDWYQWGFAGGGGGGGAAGDGRVGSVDDGGGGGGSADGGAERDVLGGG